MSNKGNYSLKKILECYSQLVKGNFPLYESVIPGKMKYLKKFLNASVANDSNNPLSTDASVLDSLVTDASNKGATSSSEQLLSDSVAMLQPLVELMVAQGVTYTQLTLALKQTFMEAARKELAAEGKKVTDAAISVRSGVHRKEVRASSAVARTVPAAGNLARKSLSLAEQIFTRWLTDAGYRTIDGKPASLPLTGPAPSFDSLAASVTKDFSRRTLLNELTRLGLVQERGDHVIPLADAVVARDDLSEMISYYRAQLHDHLAAGAANIQAVDVGAAPPFLEQSLYANGLSPESIEHLAQMSRQLWKSAFDQLVGAASQRLALDQAHQYPSRIRFGVYFYSESADQPVKEK